MPELYRVSRTKATRNPFKRQGCKEKFIRKVLGFDPSGTHTSQLMIRNLPTLYARTVRNEGFIGLAKVERSDKLCLDRRIYRAVTF